MNPYWNDPTLKIEHSPVVNKIAFPVNTVGIPCYWEVEEPTSFTPDDTNSVWVDGTAGNDGNAGTEASPVKTLETAFGKITSTKIYIILMTSEVYEDVYDFVISAYFQGIYADTGVTPSICLVHTYLGALATPDSTNCVFVSDLTGNDANPGTYALPKKTIQAGIDAVGGATAYACIIDSETYSEVLVLTGSACLGIIAIWDQAPTVIPLPEDAKTDYTDAVKALSEVEFASGNLNITGNLSAALLNNGNFVICFHDDSDGGKGKFVIYDQTGSEVVSSVTFEDGDSFGAKVAVLSNGNFVICYIDDADSDKGKFVIYTQSGDEVVSPTEFDTNGNDLQELSVSALDNDNWICVFDDSTDSDGKFVIFSNAGVEVVASTQFEAGITANISTALLDNDNWVCCYSDGGDGGKGKFVIYDEDGVNVVAPTEFEAGNTGATAITVLNNTNWVCCYSDLTAGDGKFVIYDEDGNNVIVPTQFESGGVTSKGVASLLNGGWVCCYSDGGDGGKGKFVEYNASGTQRVVPTEFEAGSTSLGNTTILLNTGNFVACFRDGGDGGKGKFVLWYPYSWTGIFKDDSDAIDVLVLHNIYLDGNNQPQMTKLIETVDASFWAFYVDFLNANNYTNEDLYPCRAGDVAGGANAHLIGYCKIHDNDSGFYVTGNTVEIFRNQFYWNIEDYALEIDGAGSDVEVYNNDFFQNFGGLNFVNNDGDEVLKNNIFHDNSNLGIDADVEVDLTNSILTDTTNNVDEGAQVVHYNPLYINEGSLDPDDIDLNLKTTVLNYPADSPGIGLSDDGSNAGSLDVLYVGAQTDYTEIEIEKPNINNFVIEHVPVGAQKDVSEDGTTETLQRAMMERITLIYDTIDNDQYEDILAMASSDESAMRLYLDPTTYPNNYDSYNYIYGSFKKTPKFYRHGGDGVADVKLVFEKKYEAP